MILPQTNNFHISSATGRVGIGTTSPATALQVDSGSLLVTGTQGAGGGVNVNGGGNRMFYDVSKGAFRAGGVSSSQWNSTSVGNHSVALGYNPIASGDYSVALGYGSNASGVNSTAIGYQSRATGGYAHTIGRNTTAQSYGSFVIGRYNVVEGSTTSWSASGPLFVIGNGIHSSSPSNAMTVLKSGNTTIGGTLTVEGTVAGSPATLSNHFVTLSQLEGVTGSGNIGVEALNGLTGNITLSGDSMVNVTTTGNTLNLSLSDFSITNQKLVNDSVTINTSGGITGGGTVALGGTLDLSVNIGDGGSGSAIGGSGNTNHIAKFTSAGVIGNSQIFDDGVSVGIGTASPSYTLDVSGNARFTGRVIGADAVNSNEFITLGQVTGVVSDAAHDPVTLSGQSYLSLSNQQITANPINLSTTNVTGTLPVNRGCTGATSFTTNNFVRVSGTGGSLISRTPAQVLTDIGGVPTSRSISTGTGLTGGGDLSANRSISVNFGTTAGTVAQGNDSRIVNGQTAFGWGNHTTAGYLSQTAINTSAKIAAIVGDEVGTGALVFNTNAIFSGNLAVNGNQFFIKGSSSRTDHFAWSETTGWINFVGGGVEVTETNITGYAYGENIGRISLSCLNDDSCGEVEYGVENDGGTLSGYAWSDYVGWIDFDPSGGGVTIDSNGDFQGFAWGENIGWISFNCENTSSCGSVDYKVSLAGLESSDGNIGIGTDNPQFTLDVRGNVGVSGDVFASAFINRSTWDSKTDVQMFVVGSSPRGYEKKIATAEADDFSNLTTDIKNKETDLSTLDKISLTNIATYRYLDDPASQIRIGLIADNPTYYTPEEVLAFDSSGKAVGVDIYQLSTFLLAGIQELDLKVDALALASGVEVPDGSLGGIIRSGLRSLGIEIRNSVAKFVGVITGALTVGSEKSPSGITLYDQVTNEPYCLVISDGETKHLPGKCEDLEGQFEEGLDTTDLIEPEGPEEQVDPKDPEEPTDPEEPEEPEMIEPEVPEIPEIPEEPEVPTTPTEPEEPNNDPSNEDQTEEVDEEVDEDEKEDGGDEDDEPDEEEEGQDDQAESGGDETEQESGEPIEDEDL